MIRAKTSAMTGKQINVKVITNNALYLVLFESPIDHRFCLNK